MLAFLENGHHPGVEVVEEDAYRRSFCLNGTEGQFAVALDEANHALSAQVQFRRPRFALLYRRAHTRDVRPQRGLGDNCGHAAHRSACSKRGSSRAPGLRVPGCWNGFELAIRAILGQQITVKGATALAGRMVRAFGQPFFAAGDLTHTFPSPEVLATASLASVGLTTARAQTIRLLARAVSDGQIGFHGIVDLDDFLARMCQIPGIGKWTAQYVAMRALGEPDAFPSGDLGLLHATNLRNSRELERRAEAWRPWRAYATMYLWTMNGERGLTRITSFASQRTRDKAPISRGSPWWAERHHRARSLVSSYEPVVRSRRRSELARPKSFTPAMKQKDFCGEFQHLNHSETVPIKAG